MGSKLSPQRLEDYFVVFSIIYYHTFHSTLEEEQSVPALMSVYRQRERVGKGMSRDGIKIVSDDSSTLTLQKNLG